MKEEIVLDTASSLSIIDEMVQKARFNFSQGSFYFIFWGFLLLGAAMFEALYSGSLNWIGWPIAGIVGAFGSSIYGARVHRGAVLLHLDRIYTAIWIIFFITLMLVLVTLLSQGIDPNGVIMIIAGFPTLLTGVVLRFAPLKWGGVGFWVFGLIGIFIYPEYSSFIYGLSMIQGYIIPGFIMQRLYEHV